MGNCIQNNYYESPFDVYANKNNQISQNERNFFEPYKFGYYSNLLSNLIKYRHEPINERILQESFDYMSEVEQKLKIIQIRQNEQNCFQKAEENDKMWILIEIQRGQIFSEIDLLNNFFVVVKFFQYEQQYPVIYQTSVCRNMQDPIWNQFIYQSIQKESGFKIDHHKFSISLFYYDNIKKQQLQYGEEIFFCFNELHNQMVFDKQIILVNLNKSQSFIQIRCQLIHDFENLLQKWKNIVSIKKDLIQNFQNKLKKQDGNSYFELQDTNSQYSDQNTYFDNYYYIQKIDDDSIFNSYSM